MRAPKRPEALRMSDSAEQAVLRKVRNGDRGEAQSTAGKRDGKQVGGGGERTCYELGKKRWRISEVVMNESENNRKTKHWKGKGQRTLMVVSSEDVISV